MDATCYTAADLAYLVARICDLKGGLLAARIVQT